MRARLIALTRLKAIQQRSSLHISTTTPETPQALPSSPPTTDIESPDAKFEVLGAPYSLLSVSLSASQYLYTRRGTLVGVNGKVENAASTLSMLEPFRRAVLGIPFVYQKISCTTPVTALISTKSPITSFAVVHLDGTLDWMVTQKRALLAWTGHTLSIRPTLNRRMSLSHWGNSQVTGRGLLALAGKGQIYQISLKHGEEYVAHPGNVLAYSVTQHPPLPYRLKSSVLRLQVPKMSLSKLIPNTKFFHVMRNTPTWKALTNLLFGLRTWLRRTIWGDRLFLHFRGPTVFLLQTRASQLSDVLTTRDVNEMADTPAGAVQAAVSLVTSDPKDKAEPSTPTTPVAKTRMSFASVGQDGRVKFEREDGSEDTKR